MVDRPLWTFVRIGRKESPQMQNGNSPNSIKFGASADNIVAHRWRSSETEQPLMFELSWLIRLFMLVIVNSHRWSLYRLSFTVNVFVRMPSAAPPPILSTQ